MALTCLTGTGSTFTLDKIPATGVVPIANITSIEGFHEEIDDIERNLLSDPIGAHQKYCPAERVQHEPIVCNVEFDPDILDGQGANDIWNVDGTPLTGVLTFPIRNPSNTQAAMLTGSGYLRRRGFEGLANNEIVAGVFEFRFDGSDDTNFQPPTYTPEAA